MPALLPIPTRPFWADISYMGLRAMPVRHFIFSIRHSELGLFQDLEWHEADWQRPLWGPCPEGHECEPPARLWLRFLCYRHEWEAMLAASPPILPPDLSLDALLTPGLRVELHVVTADGLRRLRAVRHFEGGAWSDHLRWRTDWCGEPQRPSELRPVLQIWVDHGCHIWDGESVCTTLETIFGEIVNSAHLEAMEARFDAWAETLWRWPLFYEDPLAPEREYLAGFDWPAFHRAGIRLAMEMKALVGRRGTVFYCGNPPDPGWPPQLDLLIDFPAKRRSTC